MKYKRRIYLINPNFQIKFSLLITLFLLGVTIIYPYTIYQIIDNISTQLPDTAGTIVEKKNDILLTLAGWQVGYSLIVFSACIFFSHKIAGPLYKLNLSLKKITEMDSLETLSFRKGDYFSELETSYNNAVETIRKSRSQDFEQLSEIRSYLANLALIVPEDKKIVLSEINKKINEINERYQDQR